MYRLRLRLYGSDVQEVALESGREYTFGRGENCDVRLEEQPGISRQHFRIFEDNGAWTVQVMSKFGDLVVGGQTTKTLALESGSVFKVAGYDFLFDEVSIGQMEIGRAEQISESLPMAAGAEPSMSSNLPAALGHGEEFAGDDEATKIMPSQTGLPFLRVVEDDGRESTLKLDGRKWIAGRDEGSQIVLNDRKASRRQFELAVSPQGTFIRDLGSSNGTQLNGMPLAADELKPIKSGDVIQVGRLTLHFEIRDPNFEKRLMVVSPEVLAATPNLPAAAQYEIINFPVPTGPGGAVRVEALPAQQWDSRDVAEVEKKKKLRFYLIFGIVAVLTIAFLQMKKEEPPPPPKVDQQAQDPFSKLSPQKQKQVKEIYVTAKNLYMQGKHALAADQLKKLHELLPDGYENSLSMAEECLAIAVQEENQRLAQEELKRAEEDRRTIENNVRQCEKVANTTFFADEVRQCLAPTIERNPEHPIIQEYLMRVSARVAEREAKSMAAKDYAARVARGRALYNKAESTERRGDVFGAVDAYRKHLASSFPDPDNLKSKSQRSLDSILVNVSSRVAESLRAAQNAYASQNYKAAIDNIYKVKSLDPKNNEAAELNARIRKELNVKLREYYEEAIISEGLGQIDFAKEKWRKILEIDHPDGEYYKKAKSKMRAYGGT